MRPDIVTLLRSSERAFVRQLIGTDPVAMFRWGILRATIRGMAAFNLAGRRWATKKSAGTTRMPRLTWSTAVTAPHHTTPHKKPHVSTEDELIVFTECVPIPGTQYIYLCHEEIVNKGSNKGSMSF